MWVIPAILAFLAALIVTILLLPVKIILKNDENDPLILQYKLLWKTFESDKDSDENPIIKALKTASGLGRLEKDKLETDVRDQGLQKTLSQSYSMIIDLLKELISLLKHATVTRLHITIRCTGDGADKAAIHYGQCCTVTYGLVNALRNLIKVRKKGTKVDIGCDFFGDKPLFRYEVILSVRVWYILGALWRVVMAETKRMGEQNKNQQK